MPPLAGLRFFWLLLPPVAALRLLYAGALQLVPDEAFYWVWTRHLSTGYLDHPPMIAYLIWLGTHVFGSTELGVRVVGVALSVGAMGVTVLIARRVLRDERAAVVVAIIWLTSPMLALSGLIATPDMPALFFGVLGLGCALLIADADDDPARGQAERRVRVPLLWLAFGLFTGLGLLSKYPTVLLPVGVSLAFLFSRRGLSHFRRPWIYLAGIIALLLFLPVIQWNARHHWASFAFQLHHGIAADDRAGADHRPLPVQWAIDLGTFVGEQVGVGTPVLSAIAFIVLVRYWRRYRTIAQVERVLLWTGTLPLVVFGTAALVSHHTEANWPTFAYFPLSILIGRWLADPTGSRARADWVKGGCQLACGMLVVLYIAVIPSVARWILHLPYAAPHSLKDLLGERDYGKALSQWAAANRAYVVCNRHEDAAEAAFYMTGQPDVWCVGVGSRITAYEYFDAQPDFVQIPTVLWVGGHVHLFGPAHGYSVVDQYRFVQLFGPKTTQTTVGFVLQRTGK